MKTLSAVVLLLTLAMLSCPTPIRGAENGKQPNLAVLDFTVDANAPDAADWAFGVGDLLELEFEKLGVATCERQQIGYVISERRLQSGGFVRAEDAIHEKLPSVAYLIKGRVGRSGDNGFLITASLVETKSWQEIAAFQETGKYPDGLALAVAKIAQQAASKLDRHPTGVGSAKVPAGFTNSPETALLYFKGIEHCIGGSPEYGVAYFTLAAQKDPAFTVAKLWKQRAYEMLGLDRLAATARDELIKSPVAVALNASLLSGSNSSGQIYAVPVCRNCETKAKTELFSRFKEDLTTNSEVRLFSVDWITTYARENDLRLTGMFEDGSHIGEMQWIGANILILFDGNAGGEVAVKALNVFTGEIAFSKSCHANADSVAILETELKSVLIQNRSSSGVLNNGHEGDSEFWPIKSKSPIDDFAVALKFAAKKPVRHEALLLLARRIRENGVAFGDNNLLPQVWDWLRETIDPHEPDAALWYSTAIWGKRNFVLGKRNAIPALRLKSPRFEDDFAILLNNYPESVPAQCVRFGQAQDLRDAGNHVEAAKILENLSERLPTIVSHTNQIGLGCWASLYYFTAMEALEVGHRQQANQNLAKAEEILDRKGISLLARQGYGWVYDYPRPGDCQLREQIATEQKWRPNGLPWEHMESDIAALRKQMENPSPLLSASSGVVDTKSLYISILSLQGPEATSARYHFLEVVLAEKERDPSLYCPGEKKLSFLERWHINERLKQPLWAIQWLWTQAKNDEERTRLADLAARVAEGTPPESRISLEMAVHDRERTIAAMKDQIRELEGPVSSREHMESVMKTGELLRFQDGIAAQAAYLQDEFTKALAADPKERNQSYWQRKVEAYGFASAWAAKEAGSLDKCCNDYNKLFDLSSTKPEFKWSIACLWADAEQLQGNVFKATELLRQAVDQSTGQNWYLRAPYQSSDFPIHIQKTPGGILSAEALSRLQELRGPEETTKAAAKGGTN